MNRIGSGRAIKLALALSLITGLALAFGCQSAPDADEDSQPVETIESPDDDDAPHGEPEEPADPQPTAPDPAGEPGAPAPDGPDAMAPPEQPQGEEIDDATLDEFAEAVVQTQEIGQDIEHRMNNAESPEEAQQIQEEAVVELEKGVEATGMDFQDFLLVAERVEQDPALQQRLQQRLGDQGAVPN